MPRWPSRYPPNRSRPTSRHASTTSSSDTPSRTNRATTPAGATRSTWGSCRERDRDRSARAPPRRRPCADVDTTSPPMRRPRTSPVLAASAFRMSLRSRAPDQFASRIRPKYAGVRGNTAGHREERSSVIASNGLVVRSAPSVEVCSTRSSRSAVRTGAGVASGESRRAALRTRGHGLERLSREPLVSPAPARSVRAAPPDQRPAAEQHGPVARRAGTRRRRVRARGPVCVGHRRRRGRSAPGVHGRRERAVLGRPCSVPVAARARAPAGDEIGMGGRQRRISTLARPAIEVPPEPPTARRAPRVPRRSARGGSSRCRGPRRGTAARPSGRRPRAHRSVATRKRPRCLLPLLLLEDARSLPPISVPGLISELPLVRDAISGQSLQGIAAPGRELLGGHPDVLGDDVGLHALPRPLVRQPHDAHLQHLRVVGITSRPRSGTR